jgi:hypothetical protein
MGKSPESGFNGVEKNPVFAISVSLIIAESY